MVKIGIDVGGTFTDFILMNEDDGAIRFFKVPSTPGDPSEAIKSGLIQLMADAGVDGAKVGYLGHGTTVATNIVIERKGARTGLVDDQGFPRRARDRPADPAVHLRLPRVESRRRWFARERRAEVDERIGPEGTALRPLDEGVARGGRARPQGWAGRGGRDLLPALLSRAANTKTRPRRAVQRADAGRLCQRLLANPARVPRVRAHVDDGASMLRRAAHGALSRRFRRRVASLGHPRRALHDPFQWRPDVGRDGARVSRCAPACRALRRASSGAAAIGALAGLPEPDHVRRRRHVAPTFR